MKNITTKKMTKNTNKPKNSIFPSINFTAASDSLFYASHVTIQVSAEIFLERILVTWNLVKFVMI